MAQLVSIIIPCYNAGPWVAEAIQSCLDQTYSPIEIVVIDDGSTDGSLEVIKSFRDRVHWKTGPNLGASHARNLGLAHATGDFLQFLDADDLLSPLKIESQVKLLERSPADCLAVCGVIYFNDGNDRSTGLESPGYESLNSDNPTEWLSELWTPGPGYGTTRWGMVAPHAWLLPRSIAEKIGPWAEELEMDQDGEYFCRAVLASAGIRWEATARVFYRQFRDRVSVGTETPKKLTSLMRSVDLKVEALNRHMEGPWTAKTRRAIARQYMNVVFHSVPFAPRLAYSAWRRAEAFGGYEASEFLDYSRLTRLLAKIIGWPLTKAIVSGVRWLRGIEK